MKPDVLAVLSHLLRGHATAGAAVANTLRVDAFGLSTFGRTDALDLFSTHALALSATPHVLLSPQALVVLDETPDGRCIGVYADLAEGVIARLWVVAPTAADAHCEAAVPVASDDFLSQLRVPCVGDAADHPGLPAAAWPHVLSLGGEAIAAAGPAQAASSSQAVVIRAMRAAGNANNANNADNGGNADSADSAGSGGSTGADGLIAALYSLRLQEHGAPRRAHRRLALATARCDAAGALVHSRLAISDPRPVPRAVFFAAP